uniref:Uncharacterized protein n=1 Tax=Physcomitrium patens TaxID=3218 RepID=A0A2K1IU06_PHYPA|nr:hypothetical protein PHYPA_024701 [Physcomitrium patens]
MTWKGMVGLRNGDHEKASETLTITRNLCDFFCTGSVASWNSRGHDCIQPTREMKFSFNHRANHVIELVEESDIRRTAYTHILSDLCRALKGLSRVD